MQAIAPAAGASGASTADVRRRSEPEAIGPTRDPPAPSNDSGDGGRPILPAPAAFDAAAPPDEPPPEPAFPSGDRGVGRGLADTPVLDMPIARMEVVDLPTRLGAPVTAYDSSETPPTLVIYV